jgi:ribokinase
MLVLPDEKAPVLREPALPVKEVVDTTGAGDCCRGAFTVALMEGAAAPGGSLEASYAPAMKFAAAAAALCIQKHGAMPSMPLRAEIDQLMQQKQ